MHRFQRITGLLIVSLTVLGMLAACGGSASPTATTVATRAAGAPTTAAPTTGGAATGAPTVAA
ncbi:MAG: hypothetical protein M3Z19_08230, partial [Chloroflexota bacterium]|nr:hypothetical protein [Chloroflexota bacterium]